VTRRNKVRLEIAREGAFVPAFNKNRELPATDQIVVRYRAPTIAIKNRCRKQAQTTGIADPKGVLERMEIVIERDDLATLNEMLVSVSNCSYGGNGEKERSIVSAQDLVNAPIDFEPLLKEIVEEFNSLLDHAEIDEKN
jgi:hypothetical protein